MSTLDGTLYLDGVPYTAGCSLYAFGTDNAFLATATLTGAAFVFPSLPDVFVRLYVEHGTGFPDGYIKDSGPPSANPPYLLFNAISPHTYDVLIDGVPIAPSARPWVTGAAILKQSGAYPDPSSATPADVEWADACASAVSAGLDARLYGAWGDDGADPPVLLPPPDPLPAELTYAALGAGVEAYKRREAAFGLTGYVDLQGAAIRVARDYLEGVAPLIARYATVGIA